MSEASTAGSILVADDEAGVRDSLAALFRDEGFAVVTAADGAVALKAVEEKEFDLMIVDLRMPEVGGIEVLRRVREVAPQTLVILITAYASIETAIEALRQGAQDYIVKPLIFEDVLRKVRRLLDLKHLAWEVGALRRQVERQFRFHDLVGQSAAMRRVLGLVRKVATTKATVLITGESGVGKEVVARALHAHSEAREKVFLPVNCAAIPESLLESQLFGHLRGSFTGAVTNQEGLFQRARGGTIFLDEIGDMPFGLQAKLLRAIEEKEILPLGASAPVRVDVRIVASTNKDLQKEVEQERFREDLFYRLNVVGIHIPPLRERREDIPPLVEHLVERHNHELKKNVRGVDNAAMKFLMSLPWKGNVRELDNVLERVMILGDGDWVTAEDLAMTMGTDQGALSHAADNLREAVRVYERAHIRTTLRKVGWDKRKGAEALGLSLSSLYRKLEELDIGLQEEGG
jgi:DNA-binding NtrC family response regulator